MTTKPKTILEFDPWPNAASVSARQRAELPLGARAPLHWHQLDVRVRSRLAGLASAVLEEHRAEATDAANRVDCRYFLPSRFAEQLHDMVALATGTEDRKLWVAARAAAQEDGGLAFELFQALVASGGAVPLLLESRRQIDAALARLGADPATVRAAIAERARADHELLGDDEPDAA